MVHPYKPVLPSFYCSWVSTENKCEGNSHSHNSILSATKEKLVTSSKTVSLKAVVVLLVRQRFHCHWLSLCWYHLDNFTTCIYECSRKLLEKDWYKAFIRSWGYSLCQFLLLWPKFISKLVTLTCSNYGNIYWLFQCRILKNSKGKLKNYWD